MGNSNNTNSKLKTHIETEKLFYNSGSVIEGAVFVHAMDNFQFDALYIRIEGDQFCQWFEGSSKNRRKYTGNESFYTNQYIICKFNNSTLQEGKYVYPFSLELSENIPGSFESFECEARIQYKLIAYFSNFTNEKSKQYYEIPLLIRQPFRQQVCEYQGSITKNPISCWCCDKGQIYLKVHFGKNVGFQKQKVKLQIQADNTQGKSTIKDFMIQLVQYTFVSANNGTCRTYRNVIQRKFAGKSVKSGEKLDPFQYDYIIPEIQHQSSISTLVANYYRIEVSTDFGGIGKDAPTIYSPLFILKSTYPDPMKKLSEKINVSEYKIGTKKQIFKAPQYWFKKNRYLQVMNFRLQDQLCSASQKDPMFLAP